MGHCAQGMQGDSGEGGGASLWSAYVGGGQLWGSRLVFCTCTATEAWAGCQRGSQVLNELSVAEVQVVTIDSIYLWYVTFLLNAG